MSEKTEIPVELCGKAKRINSKEEFNSFLSSGMSFLITDRENGNKIHFAGCKFLDLSYFVEKCIMNKSKNGAYYALSLDVVPEFVSSGFARYCNKCHGNS